MRVTTECFSAQASRERCEQSVRRHVQFIAQGFRGLFEFGEVIAVGLDQVAHAFDRVGFEAHAFIAIGHLGCHHRFAAARLGIGGIEPLQRMRHAGAQFGQVAQLLLRQLDLAEQRIGEDLVELGEEAVLVGGGEVAQIEVIGLGEPQQDLRRHRALVALDQIDVAGRNAEPFGDLGLRQPQLLADASKARPDEQLFSRLGSHGSLVDLFVTKITK